ncbi:MAG: hypothetical protein RLY17_2153 [Pseudomonadota bacterium]|jgi:purine/pyrimidine-nucleoside phosphorylase
MLKFNEYFTGKVKSIGFGSDSIGPASIEVMEKGEYTFSTAKAEEITVITGSLKVLIPGSAGWEIFRPGETFYIPAEREFNLLVVETSSYLCKYLN